MLGHTATKMILGHYVTEEAATAARVAAVEAHLSVSNHSPAVSDPNSPTRHCTESVGSHTKISCCPRYNSCANETTQPSPSAGLTCGKNVRLKSWTNQYLTRTTAAQGVTVAAVSPDALWTVVCANNKVQFKSTKGDYLHCPDGNPAVTTYSTGVGNEWTSELVSGKVRLKSWKGDYLHFNNGLTTYSAGNGIAGSDWTVETL